MEENKNEQEQLEEIQEAPAEERTEEVPAAVEEVSTETVTEEPAAEETPAEIPAEPAKKEALNLPKSNVLQFFLDGGTVVSARPSGTEPKIKFYINSFVPSANGLESAKKEADALINAIEKEINTILDV